MLFQEPYKSGPHNVNSHADEPAGVPASPSSEDVISFSGMNIITPAQQLLARKLTCDIMPGKSLLVTG